MKQNAEKQRTERTEPEERELTDEELASFEAAMPFALQHLGPLFRDLDPTHPADKLMLHHSSKKEKARSETAD